MLKKIQATYLSMVIIYQEQNIINMLNIFMHQTITKKINERRKERIKTEYLLHEHALLMNEYFTNPLWGLKYLTYKKEVSKAKALQNVFNVKGIVKLEEKSPRKWGSERVLNVGRPPLFIEVGMLKKISKKTYGGNS